ncbi:putative RNA polymerase I-specific transcription initiation factor rrn7 [Elsinoe australis]|uniref:Putative RNA polymerase I-specific transcription initiation factor rrn7 n=1 Tax=Elsinoe australis TaxID=40998 RepID=A0A4U7B6D2_9PEZI|nr:putative RNA polymerase I-specific transcription initiation factor rrn7 [Elsinoe australis]
MECEIYNCGSRQFHIGEDGFTYCSEGHRQLQAGLVTAGEDEGLAPTGRRTVRKTEEDSEEVALTGQEGFEHYLICFQLILWKQVRSFVESSGSPAELEAIVRDLWVLRVNSLAQRLARADDDARAESQVFSSQEETSDSERELTGNRHEKNDQTQSGVTDGLCMIYIGLMLLRQPILPIDLLRKVDNGDVLYYRAIKDLDSEMTSRLEGRYHVLMDPAMPLTLDRLRSDIRRTTTLYAQTFGLKIPPLNHHQILWRLVIDLCLPIEIFAGTLRLAGLLNIDFDVDTNPALLVVTTKLLFPMDGRERPPKKPTEPAALAMDWRAWIRSMTERQQDKRSDFNSALRTTEEQVIDLSETQLDQYMEWFKTMFTTDEPAQISGKARRDANFKQTLQRMFPLHDPPIENSFENQVAADESPARTLRNTRSVASAMRPPIHQTSYRFGNSS